MVRLSVAPASTVLMAQEVQLSLFSIRKSTEGTAKGRESASDLRTSQNY